MALSREGVNPFRTVPTKGQFYAWFIAHKSMYKLWNVNLLIIVTEQYYIQDDMKYMDILKYSKLYMMENLFLYLFR